MAPRVAPPETHGALPGKTLPPSRTRVRFTAMPSRYGLIVLGSALLMIGSVTYVPLGPQAYTPGRELLAFLSTTGGLALVFGASLPVHAPDRWRRWYARARHVALVVSLPLVFGTFATNAGVAFLTLYAPAAESYATDIVSFAHVNAELTLEGRNPYTSDDVFRQALARFPLATGTPLRGETFGTGLEHPGPLRLFTVQREYVRDPEAYADAYDPHTLHSYPALSFLIYAPLLWAGLGNILILDAVVYWLLLAWLIWLAPAGWRHWAALVGIAAMPVMAASLLPSIDIVGFALALVAWHVRDRRWLSSGLFGLALAYKQLIWFFIPFFALDILFTYGWREVVKRGALVLGAFLLPNLPYIIASPQAWFESMWLPMSEPLFATGMGIIALSIGHIIPYAPPLAYALFELAALGVALWAYARWRSRIGDGVLILALLPLFFALRSSATYFAFMPWFALYAVNRFYTPRVPPQPSPVVDAAARAVGWLRARRATLWPQLARRFKAVWRLISLTWRHAPAEARPRRARPRGAGRTTRRRPAPRAYSPRLRMAIKASCGISTLPTRFMRFLPSFCFSSSLRLRVTSPP